MKKEFLKMAGVENEKDFYKLFPTEAAFFGMYPEAKKLVQETYGGLIKAQNGAEYKGSSIVDYLATKGYKGDKAFRKNLAQQYGVENYDYSANKNLELLGKLRKNQEILNQQQKSFEPVNVETIEQLHAKSKAGLDRHTSLPGRSEAKKSVDMNRLNAMLNIASMGYKDELSQPIVTSGIKLSKGKPSKPFTRTAATSNNPENTLPEGEYDVAQPKASQSTSQQDPGFFDYAQMAGQFLGNQFSPEGIQRTFENAAGIVSDYADMGINKAKRMHALYTGEGDNEKTKSEIKIPNVTSSKRKTKLTIDGMPFQEGNAIDMVDKDDRYYTKPQWIDLNNPNLRLGARNRGSRLGDIKSEGFVITPFAKEYGSDYDDDKGANTIRRYKDSEIVNDKIYGGVDDQGKFYLDYGKNLKGKNLQLADFRDMDISGIAKDKKGRYKYGNATSNKRVAKTAIALDAEGKPTKDLNLLVPKASLKTGHESFGQIGGGRFILASPDLKYKVLISGSLKNIDDDVETFKKATGLKTIKLIPLDNGTFARGLSTKDGIITDKDQEAYDNFNNSGGAAFYLTQKRIGGSILPKAQFGWTNVGQTIGQNVVPFVQMMQQPIIQPINNNAQIGSFAGVPQITSTPSSQQTNLQRGLDMTQFRPDAQWVQDIDEQMSFQTTPTTTNYAEFFNQSLASGIIEPPKDEFGNPQTNVTWQGDPNYDPNKKTKKPRSKYLFGKVGEWFDKNALPIMATAKALNTGFALGNQLVAQKEYSDFQRNYEKNLRNKIFTQPVKPSVSGSRGDYVTNTGAFRPNEYTVNKGMYTSNMPGAVVGTQQFAKFGGPILQFGGGAIEEAIVPSVAEFSPIITPEIPIENVSENVGTSEKEINVKAPKGESIAVSHNNPGNIHFGKFTSQWDAGKGAYDNGGHIAVFNSLEDGWEAFNKLLFGKSYSNLSVAGARNKWVNGKPSMPTESSFLIAKAIGVDPNTKISQLNPEQQTKLASLFVKYEDAKMYRKLKGMKYFEKGGEVNYNEGEEYDMTEDEIRQFLENGGELEFI
jgi:hypothetical protein